MSDCNDLPIPFQLPTDAEELLDLEQLPDPPGPTVEQLLRESEERVRVLRRLEARVGELQAIHVRELSMHQADVDTLQRAIQERDGMIRRRGEQLRILTEVAGQLLDTFTFDHDAQTVSTDEEAFGRALRRFREVVQAARGMFC